jgi:transposase
MSRRQKDPLRVLEEEERKVLEQVSRSQSEPASHVARAKGILAVAAGKSYTEAAQLSGRCCGDVVAEWVARFNQEGLAALEPRHGGGPSVQYGAEQQARILAEVRRQPDREKDGTATWSLSLLQKSLRAAPDGLPEVSTYTIWMTMQEGGWSWQKDRSWCETGKVKRKRKEGVVEVTDPDAEAKKKLIVKAYTLGESLGLAVWALDEAGPFKTMPYAGYSWQPEGQPNRQPHEYIRAGTAKLMTLFHPADGQVRVKGVPSCTNAVLHPWLTGELSSILATLPPPAERLDPQAQRAVWEEWFEGLGERPELPAELPPLRLLLTTDHLAGHKSKNLVEWFIQNGIAPLYTPVGGSWLNMAESIQRILERRALDGHCPTTTDEIIAWLEATARGWNESPTPFVWGGKRAARRLRSRQRRKALYALGGSGACTRRPIGRRKTIVEKWQQACQTTH